MRSSSNHVEKYYYLMGSLKLESPLLIGCGSDEAADIECIRDADGNPFIPGTSLAGVIRQALLAGGITTIETFFGEHKDNGKQSALTFYDAYPESTPVKTEILDGVQLDDLTKTVLPGKKYDYEVVQAGQSFTFRVQGEQRTACTPKVESVMATIQKGLQNGEFSIGAKTYRGIGRVRLENPRTTSFNMATKAQAEEWLDFQWSAFNRPFTESPVTLTSPFNFTLQATFSITDSLLIRRYGVDPDDPDSTTRQNPAGRAVIPGIATSGALKHAIANLAREMGCADKMETLIRQLFGYLDDKNKAIPPIASRLDINESLAGTKFLTYIRNKVDRFTGGVVPTALFDERACYGGQAKIKLRISKCQDYEVGMILLALKELKNGIQTIGGGYNIGRGRLKMVPDTEKLTFNGTSIKDDAPYLKALATALKK
jgi:CRISPR/Cas system CSM-associated protein Csm3 (group 7 of RAMP superfamily)